MASRNAQAALEFLTSYGWALLAVVIVVGTLAYFNFDPTTILRSQCGLGAQLECAEYRLYETGRVDLRLRNNLARPIIINEIILLDSGTRVTPISGPVYIGTGKTNFTSFVLPNNLSGGRNEILIAINFSRGDVSGPSHLVAGRVYSTVLEGGNNTAPIIVPPTTLSISPASAFVGTSISATWNNIQSPSGSDWIALFNPTDIDGSSGSGRIYTNCGTAPGGGGSSGGSCNFAIPLGTLPGTYELRLYSNGGFTRLATSQPLTVSPVAFPPAPACTSGLLNCAFDQLREDRIRIRCDNDIGIDIDEARLEIINSTPGFANPITPADCTIQGVAGYSPNINIRCDTGNPYQGMGGTVVTVGYYINYSLEFDPSYSYCQGPLTGTVSGSSGPLTGSAILNLRGASPAARLLEDGTLLLRGTAQQNVNPVTPTSAEEFIFRSGTELAIINLDNGNMLLRRNVFESQSSMTSATPGMNMIFRNSTGGIVAYFDGNGNLYLRGLLEENQALT